MTHSDPAILKTFRGYGHCFWCKQTAYRQAAHIIAKGRDNCNQLDVGFNLAALCHRCHMEGHNGKEPTQLDLFALVAARDGWRDGAQVEAQLRRLLRAPPKKDGAAACPDCEGRGWIDRWNNLWRGCKFCQGSGVLVHGEAWVEQPRKLAGS